MPPEWPSSGPHVENIFLASANFPCLRASIHVTGSLALFGSAETIACRIKALIRHRFGLTCSIGIAPNKLLAKLASDMKKPDGLTIIRPEEVTRLMEIIPIQDLCGIGVKTRKQLNSLGIQTCGELGRFPVEILRRTFGVIGDRLHLMVGSAPAQTAQFRWYRTIGYCSITMVLDIVPPRLPALIRRGLND